MTVAEKKLNWWPNIESSRSLSYSGGRSTTRNTTPSTRGGGSGGHANIPGGNSDLESTLVMMHQVILT